MLTRDIISRFPGDQEDLKQDILYFSEHSKQRTTRNYDDCHSTTNYPLVAFLSFLFPHRTFDYVCRELVQIPAKLPVLIMSNFYDMHENRKITEEQVRVFLDTVEVNGNYSVSINGIKNSIIEPVVDTEGYNFIYDVLCVKLYALVLNSFILKLSLHTVQVVCRTASTQVNMSRDSIEFMSVHK
ncbi:unnamed protein product [Trichobilharzia regenti]|nr:unnamed protein product [Trichobilharzia regenti]